MCKKKGCDTTPTPGHKYCQICHDTYNIIKSLRNEIDHLGKETRRLRRERDNAEDLVQHLKKRRRTQEDRPTFRYSPPLYDPPVFEEPQPLKRQNAVADLSNLLHTLNTVFKKSKQ